MDLIIVGILLCVCFASFLALAFSTMKDQMLAHRQTIEERMSRSRPLDMDLDAKPVDHAPLPGYSRRNFLGNFQARRLERRGADCLEFRYDWKVKIAGLVSLGAG